MSAKSHKFKVGDRVYYTGDMDLGSGTVVASRHYHSRCVPVRWDKFADNPDYEYGLSIARQLRLLTKLEKALK